jgi:hypothetical protein
MRACANCEQVFSADQAKHLKPALEPYLMSDQLMSVSIRLVRLVAAHAWDIALGYMSLAVG